MHLVNRPWSRRRVAPPTVAHPLLVAPVVSQVPDYRARPGRVLGMDRQRVCLVAAIEPAPSHHPVFVDGAQAGLGNEPGPDAGAAMRRQLMRSWVPAVEVADHRHTLGVGCPDRELGAIFGRMPAELLI